MGWTYLPMRWAPHTFTISCLKDAISPTTRLPVFCLRRVFFSGRIVNCLFANIRGWAINTAGTNTISNLIVSSCQFKDVGAVTASTGGISASAFANLTITNNQFHNLAATGTATAISLSGTSVNGTVKNNKFYNCTTEITNTATWTGKIEGLPITFTPDATFATPGTSTYSPSPAIGRYTLCDGWYDVLIDMTGTVDTTGAAGELTITGVPTALTLSGARWTGSLMFNGISMGTAGYTQFSPYMLSGGNTLAVYASGTAKGLVAVDAADVPNGGTLILNLHIRYQAP